MKYVRAFLMFWYRFIIGDDWTVAALVVAALIGAWALLQVGVSPVWWLVPIVAIAALALSVHRTAPPVDAGAQDEQRPEAGERQ